MSNNYLTTLPLPFLHTSFKQSHMHAMAVTGNSGRSLSNQPHQPLTFPFPKREFGKKVVCRRSSQVSWFSKWFWLHYVEDEDAVLCYTCAHAYSEKKLQWSPNPDMAFISKGYHNWIY